MLIPAVHKNNQAPAVVKHLPVCHNHLHLTYHHPPRSRKQRTQSNPIPNLHQLQLVLTNTHIKDVLLSFLKTQLMKIPKQASLSYQFPPSLPSAKNASSASHVPENRCLPSHPSSNLSSDVYYSDNHYYETRTAEEQLNAQEYLINECFASGNPFGDKQRFHQPPARSPSLMQNKPRSLNKFQPLRCMPQTSFIKHKSLNSWVKTSSCNPPPNNKHGPKNSPPVLLLSKINKRSPLGTLVKRKYIPSPSTNNPNPANSTHQCTNHLTIAEDEPLPKSQAWWHNHPIPTDNYRSLTITTMSTKASRTLFAAKPFFYQPNTSDLSSTSISIRYYFGSSCESQATSNRNFQPQPTHEHTVQSNHYQFGTLTQNNPFTSTVPHGTTSGNTQFPKFSSASNQSHCHYAYSLQSNSPVDNQSPLSQALFCQHAIYFGKTAALNVQPRKLPNLSVPKHSFSHAYSPLSIHPLDNCDTSQAVPEHPSSSVSKTRIALGSTQPKPSVVSRPDFVPPTGIILGPSENTATIIKEPPAHIPQPNQPHDSEGPTQNSL
ncbi:hypothetical protein O181_001755 [Austropuccinia psidii MF-1]|uniref:Uncharacterized protein n=1 Tax=Austropuccinia psidii MF-1 TaxID=1389203 RepID=A0A9Q3GC59_9BASI|nr:hypothetical protein [Austropuccinia psidii MF-1]